MWGDQFRYNNGFISGCGCGGGFPAQPCPPFPSFTGCPPLVSGCPIQLDSACVIYHKGLNLPSGLNNLNLPNGSTLELILNTIDVQLGGLNAATYPIPYLKSKYQNLISLASVLSAIDVELSVDANAISVLQQNVNLPNSASGTSTITFNLTGTLNRNISASVNVSNVTGNTLLILPDGLYAEPQNLSVDYINKKLTITDGNTVDISSIVAGSIGWLGNVPADPASVDGQYWWNSTSNSLKINIGGGVIKTIVTV